MLPVDPAAASSRTPVEAQCTPRAYSHNRHGYRSDEFDSRGDLAVLAVGDSFTYGMGVQAEERWSDTFCRLLMERTGGTVTNWNMGQWGASNDYISRMLLTTLDILKPDIVIVLFSYPGRREHWYTESKATKFINSSFPEKEPQIPSHYTPEDIEHYKALRVLQNQSADRYNCWINYKLVEMTLKLRNIPWLCDMLQTDWRLKAAVDNDQFLGLAAQPALDSGSNCLHARTPVCPACSRKVSPEDDSTVRGHHWGPLTHRRFAEKALERYLALYGEPRQA